MIKKSFCTALCGLIAFAATHTTISAQTVTIPAIGDKWSYPFNFSEGFRTDIPVFGAEQPVNDPGAGLTPGSLNYHDGTMLIEFGPSVLVSPSDYQTGAPSTEYDFTAATLILTHVAPASGDGPFTWDLSSDFGVDDFGTSVPLYLNVHGVGFTTGDATSFSETDEYDGPCPGFPPCPAGTFPYKPRNPFPLNIDDMATTLTVENDSAPVSWASSVTPIGYTPGVTTSSFSVEFELDVSNPRVKTYIQEGLASGDLLFSIISNADSSGGTGGSGSTIETFPRFAANASVPGSNPDSAILVFENFTDGTASVQSWDQFD